MEVLGIDWALRVLLRLRSEDFPQPKEDLRKRLEGIRVKGKPIDEIAERMSFPIKSPAEVLRQIEEATR